MAVVGALLSGCVTSPQSGATPAEGTADFTRGRSPTCEVHHAKMAAQRVKLEFGMKRPTPESEARRRLFPHADGPYDTGSCLPLTQEYGYVFVCPRCAEARAAWLSFKNTQEK